MEEDDEDNNEFSVKFTGAFLPDLVVVGLGWSPTLPSLGASVTLEVTVRNKGKGESDKFGVWVFIDTLSVADLFFPGMPPCQSAVRSFTWAAQAGDHTIEVLVDPRKLIREANEANNAAEMIYGATRPAT